jgi:hypothetical protein
VGLSPQQRTVLLILDEAKASQTELNLGPPQRRPTAAREAAKRMEEGGGDRRPDDHEGELEVR